MTTGSDNTSADGISFARRNLIAQTDGVHNRRSFLKICNTMAGAAFVGESARLALRAAPADVKRPSHLVRFGHTDLYVTRYCQGTAFREIPRSDNPQARRILHRCLDVGINFFDSAEAYGWGGSETVLGKVIAGHRDKVVICTKAASSLAPEKDPDSNKFKLGKKIAYSRKVLSGKLEASLKRLGTDFIDLYLLHHPDEFNTPVENLVDWMDALVRSGKIRYWGISNFKADQVEKFYEICRKAKVKPPIAGTEDYYNVVARERFEPDMPPVFRRTGLGLMAFSPQDTGRLAPGRPVKPERQPLVDALDQVARDLSATRPQVCIAWVLSHPEVTTVLGGAERPEHASENFKATQLKLPAEALKKINAASDAYLRLKKQKQQKL